jgi:hypothetical protein
MIQYLDFIVLVAGILAGGFGLSLLVVTLLRFTR